MQVVLAKGVHWLAVVEGVAIIADKVCH